MYEYNMEDFQLKIARLILEPSRFYLISISVSINIP